jgi:dTDP-4-amino-4,6-dideoxygalactose transaminase
VARVGAKPVFVDIDPRTFSIDPAGIEAAITERTKAIMPVHLFGLCAEMDAVNEIAARRRLKVIEDAAQAIGATYRERFAGTLGNAGCLSFYPTKNLGGFGEGGMVFTNDAALADIVRQLRNHGESTRYHHERVGGNFRLDTLKAAVLLVKLRYLDEFTQRRQDNAERYGELLAGVPVTTPYVPDHQAAVYHQYSILCDRRDDLREYLRERGVATAIYYPMPLHLQKCFAPLGYRRGSLPVAEGTCYNILSLPCHPMLSEADLEYVASHIRQFYGITEPAAATAATPARDDGVQS